MTTNKIKEINTKIFEGKVYLVGKTYKSTVKKEAPAAF